jgi:hypothetical protein
VKEFITAVAAKESDDKEGWIEFPVVEQDTEGNRVRTMNCRAKRPTSGQVAYLSMTTHKRQSWETQVSGIINFVMAIMDDETAAYLSDRLLDHNDPFEIEQIQEIIEYLVEEWAARPTEPSSDSSKSPDTSGSTSTATEQTTSSTSASIAS